jgi:hypothetical protein
VTAEPSPRTIMTAADAAIVRRRLGPTAWVVLEIVVATADDKGIVQSSPADIAQLAGLNVDTVQRALRRLRDAQLVTVYDARAAGRFAGTRRSLVVEHLRGVALVGVASLPRAPGAVSPCTAITVTERLAAVERASFKRATPSPRHASRSSTSPATRSLFEA